MPGKQGNQAKASGFNLDDYVMVKDRVLEFYNKYPTGRIITVPIEHDRETGFVMFRAEVYRIWDDKVPASTGHAYELKSEGFVNKTSYIENCETSAVGRALGLLSHQVTNSIASREEMEKVQRMSVESDPELVAAIKKIWEEGGGTLEKLDSWVKNNNGGLGLEDISGHRQQAMLTRLEQKRAAAGTTAQPTPPPVPSPSPSPEPAQGAEPTT